MSWHSNKGIKQVNKGIKVPWLNLWDLHMNPQPADRIWIWPSLLHQPWNTSSDKKDKFRENIGKIHQVRRTFQNWLYEITSLKSEMLIEFPPLTPYIVLPYSEPVSAPGQNKVLASDSTHGPWKKCTVQYVSWNTTEIDQPKNTETWERLV